MKAEARAMAEAAERKAQGSAAAAIAEEEQVAQQQAAGAAAAAASEGAAQARSTTELESGDEIGEEADGDLDAYDEDPETPTESEEDYVEPHIDVPGIPYMAADAQGGSHMEECHRVRSRAARSRLEKFFWPGEHKHTATGLPATLVVAGQTARCGMLGWLRWISLDWNANAVCRSCAYCLARGYNCSNRA